MRIELPFPNGKLSPNRAKGVHWVATHHLKKYEFSNAYTLTKQAMNCETMNGVGLTITYHEPDRRNRDLDNMLAASKSAIDGMASALGVNDKNFNPITIIRGEVVKGGLMVVTL